MSTYQVSSKAFNLLVSHHARPKEIRPLRIPAIIEAYRELEQLAQAENDDRTARNARAWIADLTSRYDDYQTNLKSAAVTLSWRFLANNETITAPELARRAEPQCEGPRMTQLLKALTDSPHLSIQKSPSGQLRMFTH